MQVINNLIELEKRNQQTLTLHCPLVQEIDLSIYKQNQARKVIGLLIGDRQPQMTMSLKARLN